MSLYLVAAPGKKLGGKRKRHEKKKYGLLPTVTRGSKKQKKKIYFQTVSKVEWLNYRNSLEVYFFFFGFSVSLLKKKFDRPTKKVIGSFKYESLYI
jgi:hypothetical protein